MKKTPLEFWTAHRQYIQRLMKAEPNGIGLQKELDDADKELESIANGTYEAPVILHSIITIGLRSRGVSH